MKSLFFTLLLFIVPKLCISQTASIDRKIYLDSTWNKTTSENYTYYRIIESYDSQKELYKIKDYYKSGILQMEGTSKTTDPISKEGEFVLYYENGNRKCISNYTNGTLDGIYYELYENGDKKLQGKYILHKNKHFSTLKIKNYWNSNKVQKVTEGIGEYQVNNAEESGKGAIKNGFKEGIWTGKTKYPNLTYSENYKKGKLTSGISIDSLGIEYKYKEEFSYPSKLETSNLNSYLNKNIVIPQEARNNNIYGTIFLTFTLEKDGRILDVEINKGLGYGIEEEVKKLILSYKNWIMPGKVRGVPTKTMCFFPFTINSQ
jgi:antitoxin component YwqK of YwqJK toxin-antitoxin module